MSDVAAVNGFRPIAMPEHATLKEYVAIASEAIREGESFVLTTPILEDGGYPDLIPKLDSIFDGGPKYPHCIIYDAVTGNFIVSRLKDGQNIFDLIS